MKSLKDIALGTLPASFARSPGQRLNVYLTRFDKSQHSLALPFSTTHISLERWRVLTGLKAAVRFNLISILREERE